MLKNKLFCYFFLLVVTLLYSNSVKRYHYKDNGKLELTIDARNITVQYEYDIANRLIYKKCSDGTNCSFKYDAIGNCVKASNTSGITTFKYDIYGKISKTIDPNSQSISYEHDPLGKLSKIIYSETFSSGYNKRKS